MIVDLLASLFLAGQTYAFVRLVCRVDRAYRAGLAFRESALLLREGRA